MTAKPNKQTRVSKPSQLEFMEIVERGEKASPTADKHTCVCLPVDRFYHAKDHLDETHIKSLAKRS
jgi:hypothetical protein